MSTPPPPSPLPAPPPPPPPQLTRKVPPPCWTHDETLALIEAYRDRWLALRRSYLRTADWDAVAAAVSSKSSAQCRHKIEKLRQRYRAERQRCLAFPGKFFSSWVFYKNLDFIDGGSSTAVRSDLITDRKIGTGGKIRVKSRGDGSLTVLGFVGSNNCGSFDGNLNPNVDFDHDFDNGDGFCQKALNNRPFIGSKNYGNFDGIPISNPNNHHDVEPRNGFYVNSIGDRNSVPPGFKGKKNGNFGRKLKSEFGFEHETDDGIHARGEFCGKNLGSQSSIPIRVSAKNCNKINGIANPYFDMDPDDDDVVDDDDDESNTGARFRVKPKTPVDWQSAPPGFRPKNMSNHDGNSNSKPDSSILNETSSSRLKFAKKSGSGGIKRGMDPVLEIISSIKFLGEELIKVEKMKMDMAMEIEKMRMEMEMKRSEMILESQRQIVEAFVKVFMEKNKKVKVMVSPES